MQTAKVDASNLQHSPIIVRPSSSLTNNDIETHKQSVLKNLSQSNGNPSTNKQQKVSDIVQLIHRNEDNIISYQNEHLPLVSFSSGGEK
jgi:hypothetical protein